jgi:hypothetical protein
MNELKARAKEVWAKHKVSIIAFGVGLLAGLIL